MSFIISNTGNNMFCSIYIPRVSSFYTETDIALKFEDMGIGSVKRVDFSPLDTPNKAIQKAFVHFSMIYESQLASDILNTLGFTLDDNDEYNDNGCFKLYIDIDQTEYWLLLKNKNPVQETNLNIHQVVENARILEERVVEQGQIIAQLNQDIEFLMNGFVLLSEQISFKKEKKEEKGKYMIPSAEKSDNLKKALGISRENSEYVCNGCYGV